VENKTVDDDNYLKDKIEKEEEENLQTYITQSKKDELLSVKEKRVS
jgi:hypothetical protein